MNMQNYTSPTQHLLPARPAFSLQAGEQGSRCVKMKHRNASHQSGAVLVVSLMILLVLTLIGVTSMSTTVLEEKMAGGVRNQNLAFQSAEAALRNGEVWIGAQNPVPSAVGSCGSPPCQVVALDSLGNLTTQNDTWWSTNAREYGTTGTQDIAGVSADPRYIVEFRTFQNTGGLDVGLNPPQGRLYYRVTAHGTGGNATAEALLQSHYMVIAN